jgi:phosphate transport system substrate-binding protein
MSPMKIPHLLFAAALAALGGTAAAQTPAKQPRNIGESVWTQDVTGFRKALFNLGGYTKRWDLSAEPHYVPKRQVSGVLRIWGNNYIKDGVLGKYWEEEFRKYQPGIRIEYHLPTSGIAIPALACGVADLSMARAPTLMDLLTFEQVYHHPVTQIAACTGSYDVQSWGPCFIIVVNKDNPLTQISMKQLDGVFGGARRGGYVGSVWHTEYPYTRGPEENIRTWGQLGLTGEWADKPIHPGGQSIPNNASTGFSDNVLYGSMEWADGYAGFSNYVQPNHTLYTWSQQIRAAIAADKHALYWVFPAALGPEMKELAVQGKDGGPFVKRSLESCHDRSYPLTYQFYFYLDKAPGRPVDPKVDEFMHYILSQEGQTQIEREGKYLPLMPAQVAEGLAKLE